MRDSVYSEMAGQNANVIKFFTQYKICWQINSSVLLIILTERVKFLLRKSVTTSSCNSIGEVQWKAKQTIMTLILKRLNVVLCKYEYIYFSWDCNRGIDTLVVSTYVHIFKNMPEVFNQKENTVDFAEFLKIILT